MDINEITKAIRRVIRTHKDTFIQIGSSQSKLLELAAITGYAEHYKANGYSVVVQNPKGKRFFSVKTSTNGYPWNFSRFMAFLGDDKVELHMNLKVRSAHDPGIYCVDVGIVSYGKVPTEKTNEGWDCVDNADLVTFAEVKKLVVYPMLLAQFLGIVHEIKPSFLNGADMHGVAHLWPTLITLGHYSGNSTAIVSSYRERKINIKIAESYDIRLARTRGSSSASPFND